MNIFSNSTLLQRAAELMVRENKSLFQALQEIPEGADVRPDEAKALERNKGFQKILWTERHKFYKHLADDPNLTKGALIGRMLVALDKLIERGEFEKAVEATLKLAKVMGFVGTEPTTNVLLGLTQADFDKARKELEQRRTSPTTLPV
jgi:hypothetical protein